MEGRNGSEFAHNTHESLALRGGVCCCSFVFSRFSRAKRGWRVITILGYCLAFSAALCFGADADHYLAMQGDVWDTQWDMAACLFGAISALALLAKEHDRELAAER